MVRRALGLFAVLAFGCDNGFRPESLVENMRVLGVKATPAEIAPGHAALLKTLVVDPSRPGKRSTVLWLGCDPDPYNLNRSACSDPTVFQDSSSLTDQANLPPGVHVIGFGEQGAYLAPQGLFDVLPAGDVRRISGTAGPVVMFAVADEVSATPSQEELQALFGRVKDKTVRSLITLFRVQLSENPAPNTNPHLLPVSVDGEIWPEGAALLLAPGQQATFDDDVPDADFEQYTAYLPEGTEARTERMLLAWYSTAGRFSQDRTVVRGDIRTVFTAPGVDPKDPLPDDRQGTLYTVVRDTRGGQNWRQTRLWFCDAAASTPRATAVAVAAGTLTLQGTDLGSLVDVVVDGTALAAGTYDGAAGTWSASVGALASGPHALRLHGQDCSRTDGPALFIP